MGFQGQIVESKKSLGQNFFINKNLAKQISDTVLQENPDVIVEIGPGTGSFTQLLSQGTFKLILIEKDNSLAKSLTENYQSATVVNSDFLEWNLDELVQYKEKGILFFGSLPYNVSKPIIKKIIESKYFNTNAYFIIQKEVAQKYTTLEPNSSYLSTWTRLYAVVTKLLDISPESFKPRPRVNSSFVRFSPSQFNPDINKEAFEKFLKVCFKQPRKTLRNNLKNSFAFENEKANELLSQRPQHLSLSEFVFLFSNAK